MQASAGTARSSEQRARAERAANRQPAAAARTAWWHYAAWLLLLVGSLAGVHTIVEHALRKEVEATTEQANNTFTRVLVNDNWARLRPMLALDDPNPNPLRNPNLPEIDRLVRSFAKGTDLVKVKVYNARGLTIYSSDPKQIGEDKAANAGFQAAARGLIATELTFRGKFGAFDGELYERNLVSSYVPVRGATAVEAVVELYTDRTPSIQAAAERTTTVVGVLGLGLVVLFGVAAGAHARQRRALARVQASAERQRALMRGDGEIFGGTPYGKGTAGATAASTPGGARQPAWEAAALALAGPAGAASPDITDTPNPTTTWAELKRLAELEAGLEAPAAGPVAVERLTAEQVGTWREQARRRGLTVLDNLSLPPAAVAPASDATRYAELLQRLLHHGLHSLDSGTVQLKVQAAPGHLELDLITTGLQRADTLRATQASEATEALNLAIAAALVRSLGGQLRRERRQEASGGARSDWVAINLPWQLEAGPAELAPT